MNLVPSPASSSIRIGLAGWSFTDWDGVLYPAPRSKRFQQLEHVASYYDLAEINTSFYHSLKPEVSRMWLHQVAHNSRFRFTAKLNRGFTHDRLLVEDEAAEFAAGLRPLKEAGKLGALLMQFPWSFRFTEENREWVIKLRRAFHEFPLVAEMRHESWASEEALGMFIDYHIGFANIDQPAHVKAMPPTSFLTSPVGYVRLLGRSSANWMAEYSKAPSPAARHDYLYSPAQLEQWKARIQRVASFANETYVVFANDARAQSAVNALQMRHLLESRQQAAPAELQRHYWSELRECTERPRQEMLFEPEFALAS